MKVVRVILCGVPAVLLATAPASAGHLRPGLWSLTSTIRYAGVDKIPAFVLGKLAAKGIVFPSRPQTAQVNRCITPEDAAIDRLPRLTENNGACNPMEIAVTSDGYSGEAVCQSYLAGHVWYDVSFKDDTHYEGKTVFKGKSYGLAMETRTNFSAAWSNADCNAPATP